MRLDDVFEFWTPASVLTAAVSGIAMALVVTHLRPLVDARLTTFLVYILGTLWYLPLVVQRAMDPSAAEASEYRTLGTYLLYMTFFATPLAITLRWRRRS